jgi:hypothetical protein
LPHDEDGKLYCKNREILIYSGGIIMGRRSGKGVEYYSSRQTMVTFKGEFYENFRHGRGTEYDRDGTVLAVGFWQFGRRIEGKNERDRGDIDDLWKSSLPQTSD